MASITWGCVSATWFLFHGNSFALALSLQAFLSFTIASLVGFVIYSWLWHVKLSCLQTIAGLPWIMLLQALLPLSMQAVLAFCSNTLCLLSLRQQASTALWQCKLPSSEQAAIAVALRACFKCWIDAVLISSQKLFNFVTYICFYWSNQTSIFDVV